MLKITMKNTRLQKQLYRSTSPIARKLLPSKKHTLQTFAPFLAL